METLPQEILQDVLLLCDLRSLSCLICVSSWLKSNIDSSIGRIVERDCLPTVSKFVDVIKCSQLSFRWRCVYAARRNDVAGLIRLMSSEMYKNICQLDIHILREAFKSHSEEAALYICVHCEEYHYEVAIKRAVKYGMDTVVDFLLSIQELDNVFDDAVRVASQMGRHDLLLRFETRYTSKERFLDQVAVGAILAGRDANIPYGESGLCAIAAIRMGRTDGITLIDDTTVIVENALRGGHHDLARRYLDYNVRYYDISRVVVKHAPIEFIRELADRNKAMLLIAACEFDRDDILREILDKPTCFSIHSLICESALNNAKKCLAYLSTLGSYDLAMRPLATGFSLGSYAPELRKVLHTMSIESIREVWEDIMEYDGCDPDILDIILQFMA